MRLSTVLWALSSWDARRTKAWADPASIGRQLCRRGQCRGDRTEYTVRCVSSWHWKENNNGQTLDWNTRGRCCQLIFGVEDMRSLRPQVDVNWKASPSDAEERTPSRETARVLPLTGVTAGRSCVRGRMRTLTIVQCLWSPPHPPPCSWESLGCRGLRLTQHHLNGLLNVDPIPISCPEFWVPAAQEKFLMWQPCVTNR